MAALSLTAASLFIIYAMLIQPVRRREQYREFLQKVRTNPALRAPYYLNILTAKWLWVAMVGVILLLGSVPLATIGLRTPTDWTYTLLLLAEILVILPIALIIMMRRIAKTQRPGLAALLFDVKELLPRTPVDRRLWLLLSISAGICEEIVFRGFLLWYFLALGAFLNVPISLSTAVVLSSMLFGFAHIYQGWKGTLGTALAGVLLAYTYIITGSLILPIILHILIDARIVFIAPTLLKLERWRDA